MAKLGALDFFGDGAATAPAPAPAPPPAPPEAAPVTSESAARTRKRLGITVEAAGAAPPPPWHNWSDGDLDARITEALPRGGWPRPTPVQAQAAPVLLEDANPFAPPALQPVLSVVRASRTGWSNMRGGHGLDDADGAVLHFELELLDLNYERGEEKSSPGLFASLFASLFK